MAVNERRGMRLVEWFRLFKDMEAYDNRDICINPMFVYIETIYHFMWMCVMNDFIQPTMDHPFVIRNDSSRNNKALQSWAK